jgi:hypothetical protein
MRKAANLTQSNADVNIGNVSGMPESYPMPAVSAT